MIQDGRNSEGVGSDEARATAASQSNPSVSSTAGIANAQKSMADVIPQWGEFLDGLAKACEEANPEAWSELVEACEKHQAAKAMEARQGQDPRGLDGDSQRCSMGVGCDEYGVCYAEAHGRPDLCPAQAIEAGTAKTEGLGAQHESAVHAPKPNQEPTNG